MSHNVDGAETEHTEEQGLEPRLRFPEFQDTGTWNKEELSKVAFFVIERMPLGQLRTIDYISTENILPDFAGITVASKLPPSGSAICFKPDDILLSNIRPYLKKIWVSDMNGGTSNDVIVIRAKEKVSYQYLSFILRNDSFIDYIMSGAKGMKMPRGDVSLIKKFAVLYPSDSEQQKIADCLSSLDDLITTQTQKLDALKTHKKGLMQQLFPAEGETVPKLRFPEFRDAGEWKIRVLGDFLAERSQSPEKEVPLFSLTIENGITAKTERYERSFLVKNEKDAYKLVLPDDLALNPMNLRFGAIARHAGNATVAVSKYYNIFYCDKSADARFCEVYFKSDKLISFFDNMAIGSLIEKRRVHFSDFLKFNIRFPTIAEQQKIADCLSALDELISAQCQKLEALKTYKKGLMQQLFPVMDKGNV